MEKLTINIPNGYKVKSFDKETGEIYFEEIPKNITERIKTIEDAIKELGDQDEEVIELRKMEKAGITSHILYYQQIVVFTKALNEDWIADWSNSNQRKYFNWFEMGSSSGSVFRVSGCVDWHTDSSCGARLCFKSKELATYAGKQFESIYKEAFTQK